MNVRVFSLALWALAIGMCASPEVGSAKAQSEAGPGQIACRIGCGPSALAVAGFSRSQAEALLERIAENGEASTALASAEAAMDSLSAQIRALHAQWDESFLDETAESIASAETELATLRATMVQAKATLVDSALQGVSEGARSRLEGVWRAAGTRCPLAVAACAAPEDLTQVASLFSKLRRNSPEEISASDNTAASSWLSRSDVAEAQHYLDTNEGAIAQLFANWAP